MAGLDLIMYKDGLKEGRREGIEKGMQQGKIELMISMVRDKIISINDAAKRLGMSESEILKLM